MARKITWNMSNYSISVKRRPPPDPRSTTRRARQQPRTDVTETTRGLHQQPRTDVGQANRGSKNMKRTFNFCTYNTRTINDLNSHALETMIYELDNVKWDVIGLAETKVMESQIVIHDNSGHKLFLSSNETSRSNGVGFLVHKTCVSLIEGYQPISDRIAVLRLQGKFSKLVLIQCYFPTSSHCDEEVEELYDQIQSIIDNVPKRDHLFLMGDFNCKVGHLHSIYPSSIGKHSLATGNARGELLGQFCVKNNLQITNTWFQKKDKALFTWTSPDGKTKNQIDFIISRKPSSRLNILDSSTLNTPDISDHKMVRTKFRLSFSWPQKSKRILKPDLNQLKQLEVAESFQLTLQNRFAILEQETDPETIQEALTAGLHEASEAALPNKVQQDFPNWMTQKTKQAIKSKHKIRKKFGSSSTQYKIAKSESKKLVKKDQLKQLEDDIDELNNLPPHTIYHAAIKKLKAKPKNISWGIKDTKGNILTDRTSILERWANFYEDLYHDNPEQTLIEDSTSDEIPPILITEISSAINNLKCDKSPGIDNIYSEYIKAGGEPLITALLHLFNSILKTNKVPSNFKKALIVVVFKKGSRLDCNNYRPISLLSHVYKLFITIIANRVKRDLYASFPPTQAAYQPGRGTIEQILALEQIIEKSIEFNCPVHITFIDFRKAFDSVKLPNLWKLLEKTSINKNYISLLKATYDDSKALIKTDLGITRSINILKGVKQGDVLSAILFCIVAATIILQTEEECPSGFSIGGYLLSNLSYADDMAIINNSRQKLQEFLNNLSKTAANFGLQINVAKTKCMTTDKTNNILNLSVYGKQIEQVSEFVYLGHKLSSINDGYTAVQYRIGLGWAAFEKNKKILTSSRLPIRLKAKILNTYVLPVVLYGLECVNWKSTTMEKITTFQNHMMRFITNKTLLDHVKIEELLTTTKLHPISNTIQSKVLKLFGHTKRTTTGVSKICTEGKVNGKRKRGRQPKRWLDNIFKWTGLTLTTLNKSAQNRKLWKHISYVDAQSAASGDGD